MRTVPSLTHALGLALLLTGPAMAQRGDIAGWHDLAWGSSKPAVLRALQRLGVHECRDAPERTCAGDELIVDHYQEGGLAYEVDLFFTPNRGLTRVLMFADAGEAAFSRVLAELTRLYGKPGLRSSYDGEHEITRTEWNWVLPRGVAILSSEEGEGTRAGFAIAYETPLAAAAR